MPSTSGEALIVPFGLRAVMGRLFNFARDNIRTLTSGVRYAKESLDMVQNHEMRQLRT